TASLAELGVLGVCGDEDRVASLARSLLVQAAILHSPAELVVSAALGDRLLPGLDWLKWLPHCRAEEAQLERGPLGARRLVEAAGGLLADRRAQPAGAARPLPVHLLVLDEEVAPERPLLAELLADGPAHGVVTLW